MTRRRISVPCVLAVSMIVGGMSSVIWGASGSVGVGDEAPPFELPGSDGSTYRLSDYRGKQVVVLAWFVKAFTGG